MRSSLSHVKASHTSADVRIQGLTPQTCPAFPRRPRAVQRCMDLGDGKQRITCRSHTTESRAIPEVPQEWNPPSDPGGATAPPEFMPPGESNTTVRPPPEYTPPEQNPSEPQRSKPMRPVRPEEEPRVPDPETPFADPVRTPERRERIMDPDRDDPEKLPETEKV